MSRRTITTCDLCGEDKEPVIPVFMGFGERGYMYQFREANYTESLSGDTCNKCMRTLIEELRSKYYLKYEVRG